MNKRELTTVVANRLDITPAAAEASVNAILATIQDALAHGDTVTLVGFGTFKTADRAAKSSFSALAGRVIDTPAKTVPVFKPGTSLKVAVNA